MNYYRFFLANTKILLFGIFLTFFSGFGQTFVLSLYIPSIISEFGIGTSLYSGIYSAATLCSGITIVFAGKIIDRVPLKKFTLWVITGIFIANLIAGFTMNLVMLFFAIFLLRFFGQGLLSHTSITTMGRYFSKARGKALSIAILGYPLAETLMPIAVLTAIMMIGWRESFIISAAIILIIMLPLVLFLIRNFDRKNIREDSTTEQKKHSPSPDISQEKIWSQKDIVRNFFFYIFAPTTFVMGFAQTALFYFQIFIAEFKGWSPEWMAINITAYAIASSISSIFAGPVIDRFSAIRIFPFVLFPLIAGLLVLSFFTSPVATTLFWFLVGISGGVNPTVSNALYAETYGTRNLGSVRSVFTFVMIISTAAGPVVYSTFLDSGFTFNHIHLGMVALILVYIGVIILVLNKKRKIKAATGVN
jgi:MFS family permease